MGSTLGTAEALDNHAKWLVGKQENYTSQFGEDGLIAAIFERIGTVNRCCFEVGASDGLLFSNTKRLREVGWRAVLIEADAALFFRLREQETNLVRAVHERIGPDSLDAILAYHGMPHDLDFGVIDINGQDYWAWRGMERYRPRVMLVEYAYFNPPEFIPTLGAEGADKQAGLDAIISVGTEKEYTAVVKTHCNVLFVDSATWDKTESN